MQRGWFHGCPDEISRLLKQRVPRGKSSNVTNREHVCHHGDNQSDDEQSAKLGDRQKECLHALAVSKWDVAQSRDGVDEGNCEWGDSNENGYRHREAELGCLTIGNGCPFVYLEKMNRVR